MGARRASSGTRKPPVDDEHHDPSADDREHVLEEEDEPVPEEEPHRLQVDRRARHQLPGLVAVVETERQAQQVRVEGAPHVELDAERLLAGDQPPPHHRQGPRNPDEHDRDDDQVERVPVVAVNGIRNRGSRQVCGDELACLRDQRERDRDPQRPLVRAQEPE